MELRIVNSKPKYRPATLVDPPPNGYLHLSANVEPPTGPKPVPGRSPAKAALLARLARLGRALERLDSVTRATVFRSLLAPPPSGSAKTASRPARFDVIVLVETTTPGVIAEVEATEPYKHLLEELDGAAPSVHTMRAHCAKQIADVDPTRPGVFLFNYFVGADAEVALQLWDHLAGWYMTETGLDNSTLLEPIGEADYLFVNHARFDQGLPRLALQQFTKPSFYRFVRANLDANRTGAMPILCRPVPSVDT